MPFKNQSSFFSSEARCPLFPSNCVGEETAFLTEQQNLGSTEIVFRIFRRWHHKEDRLVMDNNIVLKTVILQGTKIKSQVRVRY